jgi:hypothetical protein
MARIQYGTTTPFGSKIFVAIQGIRNAQAAFQRCKQVADDLTGGGVTTSALEGSAEFNVAAGQGAAFYAAIQSVDAALFVTPSTWSPVLATVDLDQG